MLCTIYIMYIMYIVYMCITRIILKKLKIRVFMFTSKQLDPFEHNTLKNVKDRKDTFMQHLKRLH